MITDVVSLGSVLPGGGGDIVVLSRTSVWNCSGTSSLNDCLVLLLHPVSTSMQTNREMIMNTVFIFIIFTNGLFLSLSIYDNFPHVGSCSFQFHRVIGENHIS